MTSMQLKNTMEKNMDLVQMLIAMRSLSVLVAPIPKPRKARLVTQ